MDLQQLTKLAADLRLTGIEAIARPWGKSKTWACLEIGGNEYLWTPEGVYDGWCRLVADTPEAHQEAESMLKESIMRRQQSGLGGEPYATSSLEDEADRPLDEGP